MVGCEPRSREAKAVRKGRRPDRLRRGVAQVASLALALGLGIACAAAHGAGWSAYGGDDGGTRFSAASEITPQNVDRLVPLWTFHTGDRSGRPEEIMRRSNWEATPILVGKALVFCTPFDEVIALDPLSGQPHWRFDPNINVQSHPANGFTCRGVAAAAIPNAPQNALCAQRIFLGTNDARLIALDARDGKPCETFGVHGQVRLDPGMALDWPGEFQITSPPVVLGNVVIVGSSINDNGRVAEPRGAVHAFDAQTGTPLWSWDPIPQKASDPLTHEWGEGWQEAGAANVWAPMTLDAGRGLVFLPTSSPSPDFFGGRRPGNNRNANSVVALNARTGALVWAFQLVHHDIWDYDVPAQPSLATIPWEGRTRDVVIQGTKQGFVFVLDRDTGLPLSPIEERPVPASDVPGEVVSPTQPTPSRIPALVPQSIKADEAFGVSPWDREQCRNAFAGARSEGLFTPPSLRGTVLFPFTGGGINWGGVAVDPSKGIVFANTSRLMHLVQLISRDDFEAFKEAHPHNEVSAMEGAPFGMIRKVLVSPLGLPCNPPPWGELAAVDLEHGKILWQSVLGTTEELAPLHLAMHWGTPTFGAPLVTAGGVLFIGATLDRYLRAFDAASGKEIWQGRLPAPAIATPMTFDYDGRQIVVIAAGGHRDTGVRQGDAIVAFALPRPGEPGPTLLSQTLDRPGGHFVLALFEGALVLLALILVIARLLALRRARRR
jgi:quinoprotein glucose dehydrogenase